MFYKVSSLVTAETVVNMLQNYESFLHNFQEKKIDIYIEAYQNGREQGLILWVHFRNILNASKSIAYFICEHRNSDEITIYKGEYSMQSVSNDAYNHPNFFGRDFDKAVNWLATDILGGVK